MGNDDDWNVEDFGSLEEQASQRDETNLSLAILLAVQLNKIIHISSREFHDGIVLYGDGGLVRSYLPNVLESYCNAIENLCLIISPYYDEEYLKEVGEVDRSLKADAKREYWKKVYIACMKLIKRVGMLPNEKGFQYEEIGKKYTKRKEAEL